MYRLLGLSIALLPGCRGSIAPQNDVPAAEAGPPSTESRAGPSGAFVLQYADATVVVPLDPARAMTTLPGIWTGLGDTAWARIDVRIGTNEVDSATEVPICPDAETRACGIAADDEELAAHVSAMISGGGSPRWTLVDEHEEPCTCIALAGISTDEDAAQDDDTGSCEGYPAVSSTAVLAGVLYRNGMDKDESCMNFDAVKERVELRGGASSKLPAVPPTGTCVRSKGEFEIEWMPTLEQECELADPAAADQEAFFVRRGVLVHAVGEIDNDSRGCVCTSTIAVDPSHCPSPVDACGDLRPFMDPDDVENFWVANDGSAALVLDVDDIRVLRQGVATPVRSERVSGLPLGVEFHRDSPLLDVPTVPVRFRAALPRLAAADREFGGSASAWGDRCVAHLRAGRLDEAEAACFAGLRKGGKRSTRGALVDNLGRVAEARRDPATALAWYRRSDRLRPGNAVVRERIAALSATK